MTPELKSILSEIAFPVSLNNNGEIVDSSGEIPWVKIPAIHNAHQVMRDKYAPFGEELARLINTLDPKRESVSDKEISGLKT